MSNMTVEVSRPMTSAMAGKATNLIWFAAFATAAALPWMGLTSRHLTVSTQIAVNAIFAASFHLMFGLTGMLWFAQALFFGVAAYATVYLLDGFASGSVPYFPVTLLPVAGALAAAIFGFAIGWIATRRQKLAFAMISLAVSELAVGLGYVFRSISGGEEGISADRWVGPETLGITFGPQREVYLLSLAWLAVIVIIVAFVERTALGRLAVAVRENSERLAFCAYDVRRVRWIIFTLSSAIAGVSGSLFALNYEHVGLNLMGIEQSSLALFSVVLGGLGSLAGAVIGAALITVLSTFLADLTPAWLFYLGAIFTLLILLARSGFAGIMIAHRPLWYAGWPQLRSLLYPYARATAGIAVSIAAAIICSELIFTAPSGSGSVLGQPRWGIALSCAMVAGVGIFFSGTAIKRARQAYRSALRASGLADGAQNA